MKIAACYCLFKEEDYITYSLDSIYNYCDKIFIAFGSSWNNEETEFDDTQNIVSRYNDPQKKILIFNTSCKTQHEQRNFLLQLCKEYEIDYYWIIDGDEVYDENYLSNLFKEIELHPEKEIFRSYLCTYWRSVYYIISPICAHERIMIKVNSNLFFNVARQINDESNKKIHVLPNHLFHHFSYARYPERIKQKMLRSSARGMWLPNWYNEVFLGWSKNKEMENLHPCWPYVYKKAIKQEINLLPKVMWNHPFTKLDILE